MKSTKNLQKGFTLVEIMIVVAIIGLLAAIAIPNFVRARETAQANACINNLRQIDGAKQQWALENKKTSSAAVTIDNIAPYLGRAGTVSTVGATVICPSGGTTFSDSYTINVVNTAPACQKRATASTNPHKLQ